MKELIKERLQTRTQINDPALLDTIRERAHSEFLETRKKFKNPRSKMETHEIDAEISKHT